MVISNVGNGYVIIVQGGLHFYMPGEEMFALMPMFRLVSRPSGRTVFSDIIPAEQWGDTALRPACIGGARFPSRSTSAFFVVVAER